MQYENPINLYVLRLDHGQNRIVLEYKEDLIKSQSYQGHLDNIKESIDWCIKKSFHLVDSDNPG